MSRFWIGYYLCEVISKTTRPWNLWLNRKLYGIAKKIRDARR